MIAPNNARKNAQRHLRFLQLHLHFYPELDPRFYLPFKPDPHAIHSCLEHSSLIDHQ